MAHKGFTFTYAPRDDSDIVDTPGVDFSARVRLVQRFGEYAVLRIPGGSHWQGLGMSRASHPAQWLLVKIEHEQPLDRHRATVVDVAEPGSRWRVIRNIFCEQAHTLATPCECGGFYEGSGAFVHADMCSPTKREGFLNVAGYTSQGHELRGRP